MTKSVSRSFRLLAALGTMLALVDGVTVQAASLNKVWASNVGADSGTCGSVASPCATFSGALNNVAAGGEIGVLTPGDFGPVHISKSVNITNDGVGEASILVGSSGSGIQVDANSGDVISVRGLVIDGQGVGAEGIRIRVASAVHVQNCVIRNLEFSGSGAGIFLTALVSIQLFVSDTTIYNNGSAAPTGGILVKPQNTGSATVVLDRVHLENNVIGLWVIGEASTGNGAHVVIRDSVVSGNASDGILATSQPGQAAAFVVVEHTSAVNNAVTGILANGPRATIVLNDDTIYRNGAGISALNGGQLISFGNNKNFNNLGPEGAPTSLFNPM